MHKLKKILDCEVKDDRASRQIYSSDASLFEITPLCVVLPKNQTNVIATVNFAREENIPIIARGAGSGLTGGCLGSGIILDFTKYCNKIYEINIHEGWVICEPGVVQDQLNKAVKPFGLRLGPDTSTGNRATIGGMIGNNSAGAHSLRYGTMSEALLEVEIVKSDGTVQLLTNDSSINGLQKLQEKYRKAIGEQFPKTPRRASGYSLDELSHPAKLMAASEGTLGIITKVKLKLEKLPSTSSLFVLYFNDLNSAFEKAAEIFKYSPYALEIVDSTIIELGKASPALKGHLNWLKGNPKAILIVEFDRQIDFEGQLMENPEDVWLLRKSGLGLLLSRRNYSKAVTFIEDVAVLPKDLPSFMRQIEGCLKKYGREAGIYGHAGAGCIHIRPFIDLRHDLHIMQEMLLEVTDLILSYKGALSGGHGDGLSRSYLNKKLFGETLYQAFCELKELFDPYDLLNPGKIVHAKEPYAYLRKPSLEPYETFLDFSKEGGFHLAVDMCNGNGQCRKQESVMCPTFQAYGDEFHSTRARANALRAMINGSLPKDSQEVYKVLDLCIECKGCKKECPSLVDMAKMKSEFLYHYQKSHGTSLRNFLFAHIGNINKIGSLLSPLSNLLTIKPLLKLLGIDTRRPLPPFSKRLTHKTHSNPDVILFIDTYTEFNYPHIGAAAYSLLEKLGLKVHSPKWSCCGRPLISKGFLKEAKQKATALSKQLEPFKDLPIIALEPSCLSALTDDYHSFNIDLKAVTLDEFLFNHWENNPPHFAHKEENIALHTHCHQKALLGTLHTLNILKMLPGATLFEIDAGCCGMAGSFGYESEHYDFSLQIAKTKLIPSINALPSDTTLIANGLSCRSQINFTTNKRPQHLAEFLNEKLIFKD